MSSMFYNAHSGFMSKTKIAIIGDSINRDVLRKLSEVGEIVDVEKVGSEPLEVDTKVLMDLECIDEIPYYVVKKGKYK